MNTSTAKWLQKRPFIPTDDPHSSKSYILDPKNENASTKLKSIYSTCLEQSLMRFTEVRGQSFQHQFGTFRKPSCHRRGLISKTLIHTTTQQPIGRQ
jgi:hypothetical protein